MSRLSRQIIKISTTCKFPPRYSSTSIISVMDIQLLHSHTVVILSPARAVRTPSCSTVRSAPLNMHMVYMYRSWWLACEYAVVGRKWGRRGLQEGRTRRGLHNNVDVQ